MGGFNGGYTGSAEGQAQQAQARADAAMRAADDARAKANALMVSRDEYQAALQASVADRAALHAALDALTARVAALEKRALMVQTQRFATTVSVALNASILFTVTWPTAFPDATYQPALTQSPLVTGVAFSNQTATGVTVTCKAGVLIAVGSVFTVEAIRYA